MVKGTPGYVYGCTYLTSTILYSSNRNTKSSKKRLCNLSGISWNEVMKKVKAELVVWDAYCKVCWSCIYVGLPCSPHLPLPWSLPKANPFHCKGFPLFDEIGNLVDSTCAIGEFTFQAGQSLGPSNTQHLCPATQPEDNLILALTLFYWGFPSNPLPQPGPAPHFIGRRMYTQIMRLQS